MRTISASLALGLLLTTIGCAGKDDGNGDSGNPGGTDTDADSGSGGTTDGPEDPLFVDDDGDGFSEHRGDCDDTDPLVFPRAIERCNGIDDDCDTKIDDDDIDVYGQPSWWADADGDGYGNEFQEIYACVNPGGFADNPLDCDDTEATLNPDTVWYIDTDFDGYGSDALTRTACVQPGGYTSAPDDCDDTDSSVNPSADEICDELDNDCDGLVDDDDDTIIDEENGVIFYEDADGDGYGVESETTAFGCEVPPANFADNTDDCDDSDASINPGATETWYDGVDSDCLEDSDYDADGDGYDSVDHSGDDCDDAESLANPGMAEVCNDGIDNDCSGDAPECTLSLDYSSRGGYRSSDGAESGSGTAIDIAGDLDGDGLSDVVVGESGTSTTYVLLGAVTGNQTLSSTADATVTDSSGGDAGGAVSTIPDLDGDGYDELLVGCDDCDPLTAGDTYGAAWLMHGPVTSGAAVDVSGADAIWRGSSASGDFGSAFDSSADFDGDGVYDVLLGEPGSSTAYLVLGTVTASGEAATAATATFSGDGSDWVGAVLGHADFNGDGTMDYAFGAPNANSSFLGAAGALYVAYGPQTGSVDIATAYDAMGTSGTGAVGEYGSSLDAGGDLDGDGLVDLAVGAPSHSSGSGAAFVHFGTISGALDADAADVTISVGSYGFGGLGTSVRIGGDLNRDGFVDLIVSSNSASSGSVEAAVFLGPISAGSWTTDDADTTFSSFGVIGEGSVMQVGDTNHDGTHDVVLGAPSSSSFYGGVFIFHGNGM